LNEMAKFNLKKTDVRTFNIPAGRKDAPEAALLTGQAFIKTKFIAKTFRNFADTNSDCPS
jgi:hypothetical protein